jgi:AAA+ superfamily predicted ATPase
MSDTLLLQIRSGNPLIAIETVDESRALDRIYQAANTLELPVLQWSMTGGLRRYRQGILYDRVTEGTKIGDALTFIEKKDKPQVYILLDAGAHCSDAITYRQFRDLLPLCTERKATIILVESRPLPNPIKRFTIRYDLGWPSPKELEDTIRNTVKRIRDENQKKIQIDLKKSDLEHLVLSLRGLSCNEAERVIAAAIYDDFALTSEDILRLVEAKRTLLGSTGCLESIAVDFTPDDVGGLAKLKQWLAQRRGGFTIEARKYGLESPRGVLMLGVPGCGKSLCAKVVAADWKMPLLRLDPGVLYQKFIGESESQLRQALAQAEAMAPLILWIDEIEKAFASATSSAADGGLSKRMFGTLLTWMQDHRHPIFIIATANDISALPPELMRKGRFDEVFFIDVPKEDARRRILEIHLRRRRCNPEDFNLDALVEITRNFTGSELEQVIVSALFSAFTGKTELNDTHLINAIQETRPLAILMAEDIAHIRNWSENRCVSAD